MHVRTIAAARNIALVFAAVATLGLAADSTGFRTGKAELKSAGPMSFGPNGVLFIGDSAAAAIVAIETGDRSAAPKSAPVEVKALNEKVAALLGTTADQILIQDAVVNPSSKNIYLSVSRGRGPEAVPVILKVDGSGKISEVSLDKVQYATVSLPDAPSADAKDRRGQPLRVETITDIAYVDGKVIVAGLSNEEFSSSLRVLPYPFQAVNKGAGVEIFHGSHGRFETNAPVRTFVPFSINNQQHILAAYTCTPLVKIPLVDLKPGNKVKGTTIAELGNRNRPLDMIVYRKDGHDYILMANSSRGVMKLPAERLDSYQAIVTPTEKQGVPYETVENLKGVQQLDKFDDRTAMLLIDDGGSLNLRTVALP